MKSSTISGQNDMWIAFGQGLLSVRCIDRSSSSKVVLSYSDTSDKWWKDMSKLVWREHSLYKISLHCVQEDVIRQCRYKTANGH